MPPQSETNSIELYGVKYPNGVPHSARIFAAMNPTMTRNANMRSIEPEVAPVTFAQMKTPMWQSANTATAIREERTSPSSRGVPRHAALSTAQRWRLENIITIRKYPRYAPIVCSSRHGKPGFTLRSVKYPIG